jgi:hypothetical protein
VNAGAADRRPSPGVPVDERHKLLHPPVATSPMDREQILALVLVAFMILSSVGYAFAVV